MSDLPLKSVAERQMRELCELKYDVTLDELRTDKRRLWDHNLARGECFKLLHGRKWSIAKIARYFSVQENTVRYWLYPDFRERRLQHKRGQAA